MSTAAPAGPDPVAMSAEPGWSGSWVRDRVGIRVTTDGPGVDGLAAEDLVGLALRRNPRRVHLLVSRVLGKHVPTDPRLVRAAALRLGRCVARALTGDTDPRGESGPVPPGSWARALAGDAAAAEQVLRAVEAGPAPAVPEALVLGFAETATGLGHGVADALGCAVLHSTRRASRGPGYTGFEEEHSHATGHRLVPTDPDVLAALADPSTPLVLVDDELTTGRTVANTVRALHALTPRRRYVVAGLVDARGPADVAGTAALAAELGTRIDVVSLARIRVELPDDVVLRAEEVLAAADPAPVPHADPAQGTPSEREPLGERIELPRSGSGPLSGRAGMSAGSARALLAAAPGWAEELHRHVGSGEVLVLGSEELIHAPLVLATELARRHDAPVRFSTTTRSPVLTVADPGYALRSSVAFASTDATIDGPGTRYAHNVPRPGGWPTIVLVVDPGHDPGALIAPDGPLAALRRHAGRVLLLVLPDTPEGLHASS